MISEPPLAQLRDYSHDRAPGVGNDLWLSCWFLAKQEDLRKGDHPVGSPGRCGPGEFGGGERCIHE